MMEELEILRILNHYNPWWNNKPIPKSKTSSFKRGDFYIIKGTLEKKEIISIVGPRRVGKTILIHQLIKDLLDNGVNSKKVFYLSVDEMELQKGGAGLRDILETYSKYVLKESFDSLKDTCYLFLDEIQEIPDWERILKNWYDFGHNIKYVISGSSSIWISKGTEESLLGRIKTSVMMPMKFSEVLKYRDVLPKEFSMTKLAFREIIAQTTNNNNPEKLFDFFDKLIGRMLPHKNRIEIELNRYLTIGGYPEFLNETDYSSIAQAMRDKIRLIFFKDIIRYFKVRNPSVLEDLFKLLARSSGSYFNLADTAHILDIQRPTLRNYLKYLTKAYLIHSSEFYSESRRKRIRKQDKVYVSDPGVRNAVVDFLDETLINYEDEMGVVVESVLFDHLTRLKFNLEPEPEPKIFYWKNKKEIDFILTVKRKPIPIESKYTDRIPGATIDEINKFIKDNKSPFGIIITKNRFELKENVLFIPLWIFLLVV
ncbi:ATP-binding protein [Nanoarchaeota archaeon]